MFAASTGSGPFNAFSLGNDPNCARCCQATFPAFSMHDLRRTARKLMTRTQTLPDLDVAELAIGHTMKGLQTIYDDVHEYQAMIDAPSLCVAK